MDAYLEVVVDRVAEGTLVDGKLLAEGCSRLDWAGERIERVGLEEQGTSAGQ